MLSSTTPRLAPMWPPVMEHALDQAFADLLGELGKLVALEALEVGGGVDGREQGHGCSLTVSSVIPSGARDPARSKIPRSARDDTRA